jgi:transcriptional regulator with XRE-family HTH domain
MVVSTGDAARKFGAAVRQRRTQAGFSQQQLADMIPISQSAISDIELGKTHAKRAQAARIDEVLTSAGRLLSSWESQYDGYQAPEWIRELSLLESRATEIRDYHPLVVPGLLQTEDYARATIRAGNRAATEPQVEALVASRLERQGILRAESPPRYLAVVDEAVFRRPTGGLTVMAAQIDHLLSTAESERIEILVVPLETTRSHPGLDGAFRLIRVPELGEILWFETRVSGGPVEDAAAVAEHATCFADLLGVALPTDSSYSLLRKLRGEIS